MDIFDTIALLFFSLSRFCKTKSNRKTNPKNLYIRVILDQFEQYFGAQMQRKKTKKL